MTRKDYVLLASALRRARSVRMDRNGNSHPKVEWLAAVTSVSHAFGCDNPRFDAERFLTECGATE